MSFFATPYTIHFDDTMAYGSHHFLTSFKFQCAARETLLFGELVFDRPGVPEALDGIHLFTADAYSRNLNPAYLGDRLVVLLSLEEYGLVSARFCYRVINQRGEPICAGFQTHVCADPKTGNPMPLPLPVRDAYDAIREITELQKDKSFRDSVLAGGEATLKLFTPEVYQLSKAFLSERHPVAGVVSAGPQTAAPVSSTAPASPSERSIPSPVQSDVPEVWVFPGQGAFDARLLAERIKRASAVDPEFRGQLDNCARLVNELVGGDAVALLSGDVDRSARAVNQNSDLSQIAIFLQGLLGSFIRQSIAKPAILMGHSFGEITALTAAGCMSMQDGVFAVCHRIRAVKEFGPSDGKLMVVLTDRPTVAEEIAVRGLRDLAIAGRNHETQTVVSGPLDQLIQLRHALHRRGIEAIDIASPTSFHHPSLRTAAGVWLQNLRQIRFSAPNATVYSPIGRRMIAAGDDIPAILSSQFVRPFDLQGAIDDIVMAGLTRFVDCGSSGVLRRLITAAGPKSIEVLGIDEPLTSKDTSFASVPAQVSSSDAGLDVKKKAAAAPREPVATNAAAAPQGRKGQRATIAIVQQGCLLPSGATTPEQLHESIVRGRSGIFDQRQLDPYWERDFYSPNLVSDRSTSGLAGLVNDSDIRIPPNVDPQVFDSFSRAQRLLCIAIAPCINQLKSAGRVLCFIGATADGFQDQDCIAALRYAGIDPKAPDVSSRIVEKKSAYESPFAAIREVFDKVVQPGLNITLIDAACASSLYTVSLGMSALENNEADVVLAGGVYCPGPGNNCLFSQFGGLTATGCRPFDSEADGVVFAEGASFIVMKRMSDAKRHRDSILAIVRAAGLSSDGRSPSANVPQSAGQLIAVKRCYNNYNLSPATISAIEGHGTSTPAGDSTEVTTLSNFFASYTQSPLPLHSLKGAIGHTGWAAGTASIIAAIEVIRSKVFPGQINFKKPSKALAGAQGVLRVSNSSLTLPSEHLRIAIDGFGFGGANAHLVVESHIGADDYLDEPTSGDPSSPDDDELVVVAWQQEEPTLVDTSNRKRVVRFDRSAIPLPKGAVLLPDLADDMDVTQKLALATVGGVLSKLSKFGDDLRSQTSIVLVLEGKTERADEATLRVLKDRLARDLAGLPAAKLIEQAVQRSRASGPYTLQCMMPNVAAGRAALQFNLNGPNFVVDSDIHSLDAAFSSAELLLRNGADGGTKLAIVAAIHANRWPVPTATYGKASKEYAIALGVTTRKLAREFELAVQCTLAHAYRSNASSGSNTANSSTEHKVDSIVKSLTNETPASSASQTDNDLFDLHTPVWVHSPLEPSLVNYAIKDRTLIIVPADDKLVADLVDQFYQRKEETLFLLVGPKAKTIAARSAPDRWLAVDLQDQHSLQTATQTAKQFKPNLILAVDRPASWDVLPILANAASNELCELLFCTMKELASEIREGTTQLWGLFANAWDRVVHPQSGPIVGLIKATKREMPDSRMGVLALQGPSIDVAIQRLCEERAQQSNSEQEIVYEGSTRFVRRLRRTPVPKSNLQHDLSKYALNEHSVVLATGGARGVTALMVSALLQDYGCNVLAVGRSPLEQGPADPDAPHVEQEFYTKYLAANPQATPASMRASYKRTRAAWEAFDNVQNMARTGGQVRYLTADINNQEDVARIMSTIQAEFGRLDLIIHGAGVQYSKRLEDRKLSEFRQTFGIKVGGLQTLMQQCYASFGNLVPVHALTSAYSIFGNDGQHDYGSANETLDRVCDLMAAKFNQPSTTIAWSAWDGVGMTQGSEYQALASRRNLALLEAPEGQRIFRKVIKSNWPANINVPLSTAERTSYRVKTIPTATSNVLRTAEFPIDLSGLDYLQHHQARGIPTLPGAWIVDEMAAAVVRMSNGPIKYLAMENIQFRRFVKADYRNDPKYRIIVDQTPDGYVAALIGNIVSPTGVSLISDEIFATASISLQSGLGIRSLNGAMPQAGRDWTFVDDPYCNPNQNVRLSGPFDCLTEIAIGRESRHATFVPRVNGAWTDTIPALLLDASLRVAGMHVVDDALHVPTTIQRAVIPVGVSTESLANQAWRIQAGKPQLDGDNIRCGRVEITSQDARLQAFIEGAVVTRLQ